MTTHKKCIKMHFQTNISYSNRNTSSICIPNNTAILCANLMDGLYLPFSSQLPTT